MSRCNSKFRHHYIKGIARVEQDPPQEQLHLESALTYAQEKNLERHAVTDERELMRDALKRSMGEASFAEILELSSLEQPSHSFKAMLYLSGDEKSQQRD